MIALITATILLFDGPLPWGLPALPAVPTSASPTVTLDELTHSADYDDQVTAATGQVDGWSTPINDAIDSLGNWLGAEGSVTTGEGGDFTMGLSPIDDVGTANETAEWMGTQVGSLFDYVRTAQTLTGEVTGTIVTVVLVCAAVLLSVQIFGFVMQFADFVWNLAVQIIEMIGAYLPTGG